MPGIQKKRVFGIRRERYKAVRVAVDSTVKRIEGRGYVILPSAKSKLKRHIAKAVELGTIKVGGQVRTATAGLVAAGVTTALTEKTMRVTPRHITVGWKKHIMASGNCPPHKCLLRSVVNREQELIKKNQVFASLVTVKEE